MSRTEYYRYILCLSLFLIGFILGYHFSFNYKHKHIAILSEFSTAHLNFYKLFLVIFVRNLIVGILLSVFGFFSGGFITVGILIWNGLIIGILVKSYASDLGVVKYFIYHGPFEVHALFLFGLIGFRGYEFYYKLFMGEEYTTILPRIKEFYMPTLLLLFAGVIESYIML